MLLIILLAVVQLLLPGPLLAESSWGSGEVTPADNQGLKVLELTPKGWKFHSCMQRLAQVAEGANIPLFAPSQNRLPIPAQIPRMFSEHVAANMADEQVDAFCSAVHHPIMPAALGLLVSLPPATNMTSGQQATTADLSTAFQEDPATRIWLPLNAQYDLAANIPALKTLLDFVPNAVYPDKSGAVRSATQSVAVQVQVCTAIEISIFVIETTCRALGLLPNPLSPNTWTGGGTLAVMAGTWTSGSAIAENTCIVTETLTKAAFEGCKLVTTYSSYVDGLVDAVEIQAGYENTRKTMENQLKLWQKMEADTQNLLRVLEYTNQKMEDALETLATQNCDLKNQLADVQRETNYLRYLVLTPTAKRPSFASSAGSCSQSQPEPCAAASTKRPAVPAVFDPPASCLVSDGVRNFDLNDS